MGIIELAIAAVIAAIAAFFGGKHLGKRDGETIAAIKQSSKDANRIIESNKKALDAEKLVIKGADDVRTEVSNISDGDAISELRKHYVRD